MNPNAAFLALMGAFQEKNAEGVAEYLTVLCVWFAAGSECPVVATQDEISKGIADAGAFLCNRLKVLEDFAEDFEKNTGCNIL